MIDLHSHILPGIDDGATDLKESLAIAQRYIRLGYKQVVATPHFVFGSQWKVESEEVSKKVDTVNRALAAKGLGLKVLPGMEIAMTPEILKLLREGRLLTLAGSRYVLVELPFHRLPLGWDRILFELTAGGFRVLLAHPERCRQLLSDRGLIDEMASAGVYAQTNWTSFVGMYGRDVQAFACDLAARGFFHLLATDCHGPDTQHLRCLREAVEKVRGLVGQKNLRLLAKENPERLVAGKELLAMQVQHQEPTKHKHRWFRR